MSNVSLEMGSHGSIGTITRWIEDLRNENLEAVPKIWNRFVERLVSVANRRLKNSSCRIVDGEDIAAEAFADFFQRSPNDFVSLVDRSDLWQILVMITERRAIDAIRRASSQRMGGGRVVGESALAGGDDENTNAFDHLPGSGFQPDIELILIEAFDERLASLDSDLLRLMAVDRMHGLSNAEIAKKYKMSMRSVQRKYEIIRKIWREA